MNLQIPKKAAVINSFADMDAVPSPRQLPIEQP